MCDGKPACSFAPIPTWWRSEHPLPVAVAGHSGLDTTIFILSLGNRDVPRMGLSNKQGNGCAYLSSEDPRKAGNWETGQERGFNK